MFFLLPSCSNGNNIKDEKVEIVDSVQLEAFSTPTGEVIMVSTEPDSATFYKDPVSKENCFILISKKELRLYVYEANHGDTIRIAHFPVCLSKNKGNKERRGDMKTPESTLANPFTISQIQDASTWTHDFHDGRGAIKAYGHWFLRLITPGHSGIGIHGSTNNENSVPGRASEGCIRLRDSDIIALKDKYAFKGMNVVIKSEEQGKFSFEMDK